MLQQDGKEKLAKKYDGFDWTRIVGNIFAVLLLIRGIAFLTTEDYLFHYQVQTCAYVCIGLSFVCFILSNRIQNLTVNEPKSPSVKETKSALKDFKE